MLPLELLLVRRRTTFFNQLNAFMLSMPAGQESITSSLMISILTLVPGLIEMMMMMLVMNGVEYWAFYYVIRLQFITLTLRRKMHKMDLANILSITDSSECGLQ